MFGGMGGMNNMNGMMKKMQKQLLEYIKRNTKKLYLVKQFIILMQ